MAGRPRKHGADSKKAPEKGRTVFEQGFERIREAIGAKTQLELANTLEICQSSISDAKSRGVIPGEWAIKLFRLCRINPNWIYEGLPPRILSGLPGGSDESARDIPKSFLRKYPAERLLAVPVTDASMEPLIRRSAYVGLLLGERELHNGDVYGLNMPVEGLILREAYLKDAGRQVQFCARNPAITPLSLPLEESFRLLAGRVVWVMQ